MPLSPVHIASPLTNRKHTAAADVPVKNWETDAASRPCTITGELREVTVLSPNCPWTFAPQLVWVRYVFLLNYFPLTKFL
jgi:hypothetical protein